MFSINERRKAIAKELEKNEKKQKKLAKKSFKKNKHGIPILKATKKSKMKEIRKTFTKNFRKRFDDMTKEEQEDLILGMENVKYFQDPKVIREKRKIERKETKYKDREFKKYINKKNITNLNQLMFAERDFNTFLMAKEDSKRKKGLIVTDPLMKSVFRIDERKLEKTLESLYKESRSSASKALEQFDKLMKGDSTKIDLSLLREKDDIIESSTKKLMKSLNKTHLDSFRL